MAFPVYPKPGTICKHCGKREATVNWTGEGGVMGGIHGFYEPWCELCCNRASLEYARKQADRIPELEKLIKELEENEKNQ